ncbi:MAG: ATP-binding protein [Dechloromonas sp.]|nr:ATP-binding protein [Dechloromonas sp.]
MPAKRKPETLALIVALISTAAVLLVFLADLIVSRERDLAEGEQRLQQFTVMMAEHTARAFEAVDVLVREIAIDLSASRQDWQNWEAVRGWEYIAQRHSRAMPQLRDLIIFDAAGNQRFISTYFPPPRINVRDRPYFLTLENGAPSTTFGPYVGRNSGRYTYAIAHRLNDDRNRFAGAAFAAIEPSYMQDFCWANRLSDDFEAVLTNAQGVIIASCRPSDLTPNAKVVGQAVGEALYASQLRDMIPASGLARERGMAISVSQVPGFPDLRLIGIQPQQTMLSNWYDRRFELATLGLLVAVVSLIGALVVRRQIREMAALTERLAENRARLETRIQEATAELADKKNNAEQANAAKSRFLAAASHDLRQPLHALGLFSADLQRQVKHGKTREVGQLAERIASSASILSEMLDALLDISRLDISGVKPNIRPIALSPLFERLNLAFQPLAEERNIRLRIHGSRLLIHSDPVLLEQILSNLLSNALRYTPSGGRVLLGARLSQQGIRIEVRDSGIGIAPQHQAAIFTEFYQVANSAREQGGGLGLGLSIVERLTRALQIKLELHSAINAGTRFLLTVRRHLPTANNPTESPAPAVNIAERLHLIGDSVALAECRALAETWGYEISDGPPSSAAHLRSDIIVLCDAVLVDQLTTHAPLIVLQPDKETDIPHHGLRLLLPVRPARLRALLRAASQRPAENLAV